MNSKVARLLAGAVVCAVLAMALASPATAQAKESRQIAECRELDKQLIAALQALDVDKVMSHYWNSPELFGVDGSGRVVKGFEASKQNTIGFFSATQSFKLQFTDSNYWVVGDSVLGANGYTFSLAMKDGSKPSGSGRYVNLRKKVAGKWVIVFEQVSDNPPPPPSPTDSLYKRLGGYDALAAVSDDFLGRLASDKQLGRFFQGVSKAHNDSIRQHVVDFLCMATGGPCVYVGRDMKSTHAGLGITGADWDRMVGFLNQTLDKFSVPDRERKEVLGALGGLKSDIVDKP